jgi:hypothetical protein
MAEQRRSGVDVQVDDVDPVEQRRLLEDVRADDDLSRQLRDDLEQLENLGGGGA